jgi:DNA repair ATPase RecN
MVSASAKKFGRKLLWPIWACVSGRVEERVRPLEASVDALSSQESEHADTLYRRMYTAELQTNHVQVLDRIVSDLSLRMSAAELQTNHVQVLDRIVSDLSRRMSSAELQTNHVPVLDRGLKEVSQRLNELEYDWRKHLSSLLTVVRGVAALGREFASLSEGLEVSGPEERQALAALRKRLNDEASKLWQAAREADNRLDDLWNSSRNESRALSGPARKIYSQLRSAVGMIATD